MLIDSLDNLMNPDRTFHRVPSTDSSKDECYRRIERIQQLKCFGSELEDEGVRGIDLSDLISGGARLFADGGAAARLDPMGIFALSVPVAKLSFFVSHSWRSSRFRKYLALAFHFNGGPACFVSVVVNILLFSFELFAYDSMPQALLTPIETFQYDKKILVPFLCTLLTPVSFFIVLFTAQHFQSGLSFFLDIACIPQDDERAKDKAISSLGAALDRSEHMVALIDDNYWKRLWCVFEVAAFYRRAGIQRLQFLPLHVPLIQSLMVIVFYSENITFLFIASSDVSFISNVFSTVALYLAVLIFHMGRKSSDAIGALRHYSLQTAECYDQRDRLAIMSTIGDWFADEVRGLAEIDEEKERRIGQHRFEKFVQNDLLVLLEKDFIRHIAPPRLIWVLVQLLTLPLVCDWLVSPHVRMWGVGQSLIMMTTTAPLFIAYIVVPFVGSKTLATLEVRHNIYVAHCCAFLVMVFGATLTNIVYAAVLTPRALFNIQFGVPQDDVDDGALLILKFQVAICLHCAMAGAYYLTS